MTLLLNGTNGVSDVDGSASTPAVRGTDTNTGIFFPAADTIAFAEGGVESMRIDSNGNVGIGTSSPISDAKLTISAPLEPVLFFQRAEGGNNDAAIQVSSGGAMLFKNGADSSTAAGLTERMRVSSTGQLLAGSTSSTQGHYLGGDFSNKWTLVVENTNSSLPNGINISYSASAPNNTARDFIYANDTGGVRFSVRSNGGIQNYSANNSNLSDAREKTSVELAGSYLDKICAIPVKTFNYIDQNLEEDAGLTLGVIAQDVQAVAPELVMESNWGTQEEPKMRLSIYQTDLQYALMKCIQEQQAIITDLKSRIEALEQA
jgi:hypothetical protein